MKANIFLVMLSLGAIALSGCIFEPIDEPDPAETTDGDSGTSVDPADTNETAEGEPAPTRSSVPVSLSASNLSGEAPFTLTFNLSSGSPNAKFLDWSLDADGDDTADKTGYGLPAEVPFTFEEAGNHTARLSVTDPEGLTGNATLEIEVAAPPEVVLPDPIMFSGTITGLSDNLGGYLIGGAEEHEFNLTVPVNNITITFTTGETAVDLDFVLLRPDGEEADAKENFNEPTGMAYSSSEKPMLIEDAEHLDVFGTWAIVVKPYISFEGTYTITVTFG